eukprot:IDg21638t1
MTEKVKLKIQKHIYESRFIIADTRYDIILGTPWHRDVQPDTDYEKAIVRIGSTKIHGERTNCQAYKLPNELPPERSMDHEIITDQNAKIPNRGLYRLSPDELCATREYIQENLRNGRIRSSKSPYGAPLFFAKQPGKPLRGVVDYRMLNKITKKNRTPTPRSDEIFDIIGGSKYFTKIDLKTGFHQIRVKPDHIEKTAFQTKYGQYEYLVLPMGLCNAPATFTAMMNEVLSGYIDKFCTVYLDEILIFSKSTPEHREHVRNVLSRLREHRLYASPKKCHFMTQEVEFLGIIVNRDGLQVNPEKTEVIQNWPVPTTIARPLTELTKKGKSIRDWNGTCERALAMIKKALVSAPVLSYPHFELPYKGYTDASQYAIGGTLTQVIDGTEHVISYFSRKFNDAQMNYTANDRELLGLIGFLSHFRCYLEGSEFETFTDNQVLKYLFEKKNISRREARWLDLLSDFGIFPINLTKGKLHVLGDTLSRAKHETKALELQNVTVVSWDLSDQADFKKSLEDDQVFGPIIEGMYDTSSSNIRFSYENGILRFRTGELCIPRKYVRIILAIAHDGPAAGHFGEAKTLCRLKNYYWRKKTRDVK